MCKGVCGDEWWWCVAVGRPGDDRGRSDGLPVVVLVGDDLHADGEPGGRPPDGDGH